MTEELMNNFKTSIAGVNLIPGGGGVFEVIVDGQLIFSKKETKRFPNDQELSQLIEEKNLLQRIPE
jgi:selenoprotein W-related protein